MQACSLSASNLACRRGDRILFRGLSFTLEGGQAMHITGTNGIGKTSLMRILAGLLRPYEGAVDQRPGLAGSDAASAFGLALVDERPALDPQLTLGDALSFWASLDGAVDSGDALGTLGLDELTEVPFRYLSTGQKKRAAFARLLNQNARIWLLDEPLNGLDIEGVALAERLVADHIGAGGLAVIASHQPIHLPGGKTLALQDYAA